MEKWKDIKGYEGLYQVSTLGRIKSLERYVKGKNDKNFKVCEKIKKASIKENGYMSVQLYKNNIVSSKYVHRLVAEAFIDNISDKPTVNHIDCNKENNNLSNLEWSTYKEQEEHKIKLGRRKQTNDKKICVYYKDGSSKIYNSITKCSKELNICRDTIYNIINKLNSKCKEKFNILSIEYINK